MSTCMIAALVWMEIGTGPAQTSMETIREPNLHLDGQWKGLYQHCLDRPYEIVLNFENNKFVSGSIIILEGTIRDEGGGRFRIRGHGSEHLGVYDQIGNELIIAFYIEKNERPVNFRAETGKEVLILCPVSRQRSKQRLQKETESRAPRVK